MNRFEKQSSVNDYLIGTVLGIVLVVAVVVSTIWTPSIWADENRWWMRLCFYSVSLFAVLLSSNWRFRRRSRLWIVLAILAAVHTAVVLSFINQIRNLSGRSIAVAILFIEAFIGLLVLDRALHSSDEDV
jgi:drug/metabolite transporter (DMT)-like permease